MLLPALFRVTLQLTPSGDMVCCVHCAGGCGTCTCPPQPSIFVGADLSAGTLSGVRPVVPTWLVASAAGSLQADVSSPSSVPASTLGVQLPGARVSSLASTRHSSRDQWPHRLWRQGPPYRNPPPRRPQPWCSPFRGCWASPGHWWRKSRKESSLT